MHGSMEVDCVLEHGNYPGEDKLNLAAFHMNRPFRSYLAFRPVLKESL